MYLYCNSLTVYPLQDVSLSSIVFTSKFFPPLGASWLSRDFLYPDSQGTHVSRLLRYYGTLAIETWSAQPVSINDGICFFFFAIIPYLSNLDRTTTMMPGFLLHIRHLTAFSLVCRLVFPRRQPAYSLSTSSPNSSIHARDVYRLALAYLLRRS